MVRILMVGTKLAPFALLGTIVHTLIWHSKFLAVLVNMPSPVVPSVQIVPLDIAALVQDLLLLHALSVLTR